MEGFFYGSFNLLWRVFSLQVFTLRVMQVFRSLLKNPYKQYRIYIYWILLTCALWAHNSISFFKKVLSGIEKAIITDLRMEAKKRKRRFAFIGGNELGIGLGHYEPSTHTIANLLWRVSFMAHLICY